MTRVRFLIHGSMINHYPLLILRCIPQRKSKNITVPRHMQNSNLQCDVSCPNLRKEVSTGLPGSAAGLRSPFYTSTVCYWLRGTK